MCWFVPWGNCMRLLPIRALLPLINYARNFPAACSNIEFISLELQRFWVVSKNDRGKLCAKFVWGGLDVASRSSASSCRRPPAPRPGLQVLPARFAPAVPGVLLCWLARSLPCVRYRSSPVEWCNRFVSFGVGYALSWSGGSSCWVGCGVSRDLVRMSRLR